jgi:hypothetical protein
LRRLADKEHVIETYKKLTEPRINPRLLER